MRALYRGDPLSRLDLPPCWRHTLSPRRKETRMKKKPSKGRGAAASGIDIGISAQDRAAITAGLSRLLADTYTLYLTTHNFHWNVTGPMFNSLHVMFMT